MFTFVRAASGWNMDFFAEYADQIGGFLSWASNPETSIPLVKLLQALAALVGAAISAMGFYKAWRFAERRLGRRLTEFIDQEESRLVEARASARELRSSQSAARSAAPQIFTNSELKEALKQFHRGRFKKAEGHLLESLARTEAREAMAQEKVSLHGRQRATANLLLGAIADHNRDHQKALAHFQAALAFDDRDLEALEYVALQNLKLGNSVQALSQFTSLASSANSAGMKLLEARALLNCGKAHESLPTPSYFNANIAYRDALTAFPQGSPALDVAYVHELRGRANMKLRNRNQANASLMDALTRYSRLEHTGGVSAKEAKEGVQRIHQALAELQAIAIGPQLGNGATIVAPPGSTMPADNLTSHGNDGTIN